MILVSYIKELNIDGFLRELTPRRPQPSPEVAYRSPLGPAYPPSPSTLKAHGHCNFFYEYSQPKAIWMPVKSASVLSA